MIENLLKGFLPAMPVIGFLVIAIIVAMILKKRPVSTGQDFSSYSSKPFLLSKAEYSFYQILRQVLGDKYCIFSKVRLVDIVNVRGGKNYYPAFNRIKSSHVDFVICDKATKVILVIELDDKSHAQPKAQKADAFKDELFKAIGLRCVRFEPKQSYHTDDIRQKLLDKPAEKAEELLA